MAARRDNDQVSHVWMLKEDRDKLNEISKETGIARWKLISLAVDELQNKIKSQPSNDLVRIA